MAIQIPTYNAQISPLARTGSVKANPAEMSDDGSGNITRAVAGLGSAIGGIGIELAEQAGRIELSTAERKRDERFLAAMNELETAQMPETADQWREYQNKVTQSAIKDIQTYGPKSKKFGSAYQMGLNDRIPYFSEKIRSVSENKLKQKIAIDSEINLNEAIKRIDYQAVGDIVTDRIEAGIITKKQGEVELTAAKYQITKTIVWQEALKQGTAEGIAYISNPQLSPGLDIKDRQAMVKSLEFFDNQRKAAEKAQKEVATEEDLTMIVTGMVDNSLTIDAIMQSSLDAKEKMSWVEKLESRTKAAADGKDHPLNNSDPAVKLDISKKINLDENITKAQIYNLVGKGLSVSDGEKYALALKNRDKVGPQVKRRIADGASYIKNVMIDGGFYEEKKSGFFGRKSKGPNIEALQVLNTRIDQLEEFWRINPEATPEQEKRFLELLTTDVWSDWRDSVLDKGPYEQSNAAIAMEMRQLGLDNEKIDVSFDLEPQYQLGETRTINGTNYTYVGDDKWEL